VRKALFIFAVVIVAALTSSPILHSLTTTPGWVKILGSTLIGGSENATPCPPNGFRGYTPQPGGLANGFATSCHDVIGDPSSAAIDTKRNRMVLWGGGHNDYGGNEIYSLEINLIGNTPISPTTFGPLVRLTNPAPPNLQNLQIETLIPGPSLAPGNTQFGPCAGACTTNPGWPDPSVAGGTPNSRHLYDGWRYDANLDAGIAVGGARNVTGGASSATWVLPMNSVDATQCGASTPVVVSGVCDPQWSNKGTTYAGPGTGTMMNIDPNTNYVWLYSSNIGNQLFVQADNNLAAGWVAAGSGPNGFGFRMDSVIDTDRDYFVHIGNNPPGDTIGYWPLAGYKIGTSGPITHVTPTLDASCTTMQTTWVNLQTAGAPNITTNYVGAFYDPIGHRVVMWPGTGNTIWFMDTGTWKCTTEIYGATKGVDYPQDTDDEGASGVTGTFSRFGYFANLDLVLLCNDPRHDCWYLHLRRGNVVVK
jgi:hypothetical protein